MNEKHIQMISLVMIVAGLTFVVFLYSTEPRSFAEVTSKGSVAIGTYSVDRSEFDRGLAAFRQEDFAGARASFDRGDPEKRDAPTQFYVAYSYYRQGWGRLSNDDALFQAGLESASRALAIDPNLRVADQTLVMKTPLELRNELDEGLKLTASDLNPLKLMRERK
ncbi:MAG TPA: hypothetical protein VNA17_09195 [Pyrinomonadaceae bacterium]|nr:hypothetical protein [Pyrinomonadaceae bacterium]